MVEIQRLFVDGALREGAQLPPERELAEQLGVGRSSVRAAIQGLQLMGLVEVRHGIGSFLISEPGRWLLEPLRWAYGSRGQLFVELLEARLSVEVALARLAAERATPEDVEGIRIAAQRRAEAAPGRYIHTGFDFHQTVACAAHSHVLSFMLTAAKQLYLDVLEDLEHPSKLLQAFNSVQVEGHARILVAIEDGDAAAAASAMETHLIDLRGYYPRLVLSTASDTGQGEGG